MKRLLSVICLVGVTLMACQKELNELDPHPVNVIGFWEGKYVDTNPAGEGYFAVLLRADSTARVYIEEPDIEVKDTATVASRTETTFKHLVDSKKVLFTYTHQEYPAIDLSTSGTVNDAVTDIAGTWGKAPSDSDRGTYIITKK